MVLRTSHPHFPYLLIFNPGDSQVVGPQSPFLLAAMPPPQVAHHLPVRSIALLKHWKSPGYSVLCVCDFDCSLAWSVSHVSHTLDFVPLGFIHLQAPPKVHLFHQPSQYLLLHLSDKGEHYVFLQPVPMSAFAP